MLVLLESDVGVMSAAILDIEEDMDLTAFQAEVLVGSLNVIAAFGGLIAGEYSGAPASSSPRSCAISYTQHLKKKSVFVFCFFATFSGEGESVRVLHLFPLRDPPPKKTYNVRF